MTVDANEMLDDFWRDVIDDNKVGYFIGPMVGWRHAETEPRDPSLTGSSGS